MVTSVLAIVSRKYAIDTDYGVSKLCEVGKRGGADMWDKQEDGVM